jgi:hypothetical protein
MGNVCGDGNGNVKATPEQREAIKANEEIEQMLRKEKKQQRLKILLLGKSFILLDVMTHFKVPFSPSVSFSLLLLPLLFASFPLLSSELIHHSSRLPFLSLLF